MTDKQPHLLPFPAIPQVLTLESIEQLNATRERLIGGRVFDVASTAILRALQAAVHACMIPTELLTEEEPGSESGSTPPHTHPGGELTPLP